MDRSDLVALVATIKRAGDRVARSCDKSLPSPDNEEHYFQRAAEIVDAARKEYPGA